MKKRIETSSEKYSSSYLKQRVGEDSFKYSMLAIIDAFRWCMVIYGIYLISIGNLELGSLLIIYNYFTQLIDGFSEFATINTGIRQLKVSQDRFYQLIIYSHKKLQIDKKYKFKNFDIRFENILYGNRLNPRLNNVTFNIQGNAINSIVGVEGAGKSGVVDLLLKLNSQHTGTISIDDILINDIDFDSYFKLVAAVDKNDRFLNISIKDNLNIINKNFALAVELCKDLGIHDDILMLKDGYDTILNSADDTLKSNIKILLNIVRILLKKPRVMIFDEVIGALDKESRIKVVNILEEIKEEHTIIIVDRKTDILVKSDNIIVLDNKEVVVDGSHQKLLKNKFYKKIIEE